MQQKDGMNYAPEMVSAEVVSRGEFVFAVSHMDHGHIIAQAIGLSRAGGVCKYLYEPDTSRHAKLGELLETGTRVVSRFEEILEDPEVQLVTSAAIPDLRCGIGIQVMDAGKDYLTDKSPFTTLDQLEQAREAVKRTGRKYAVCFSERLCSESTWYAGEMIRDGAIGKVLSVINLAPHNLNAPSRPEWFFQKERFGGILTDIGSHQFEQFLYFSAASDAKIRFARVDNLGNPDYPGLEDFGEAALELDTGASAYCRLDWFNPPGLRTWGDGRTFVVGDKGTLEIRKYINVAMDDGGDRIYLVDQEGEHCIECAGKVGFPFFGRLILDCLNRTEEAMTQEHAFKAAELSMQAQAMADEARMANVS